MPFFFNNENIEVIMEDNPDDIFTPSEINHEPSSRKKRSIKQLISQEIIYMLEKHIGKPVVKNSLFIKADSIREDMGLSYLFTFETDTDEYEITYHIPFELANILEQHNSKEIFMSLCNSIVTCLNEEDFAFLQYIEVIDLCSKTVDYKKTLTNLYSLKLVIDEKEYKFYLQFDNQFNKIS